MATASDARSWSPVLGGVDLIEVPDIWHKFNVSVLYDPDEPDELRVPWDTPIKRQDGTERVYDWVRTTENEELR